MHKGQVPMLVVNKGPSSHHPYCVLVNHTGHQDYEARNLTIKLTAHKCMGKSNGIGVYFR